MRTPTLLLLALAVLASLGACQTRPLSPQERYEQHLFQTGCRPSDAEGYEMNLSYCGHRG